MRQRLTIVLTFVVIIGLLVLLNSVAHVKQDKVQDFEITPNRSTYHAGPTGLRALHDFLNESGYKIVRWREAPRKLLGDSGKLVTTFVVVGQTKIPVDDDDAKSLRDWVSAGGRLVIIDRKLDSLLPESGGWRIFTSALETPFFDVDPGNSGQMTDGVTALQPVQPTVLTTNIQSVMPSRFASRLRILPPSEDESSEDNEPPVKVRAGDRSSKVVIDEPLPAVAISTSPAPIVHISDSRGALLVDYTYGLGKIVILSDPYIVTNSGIKLNDNLQLAINAITAREGVIAFDEYHQGRGVTENAFAAYFAGTPVLALAGQIVLLVLLLLWTSSRRFGRPLPLPHVDRRSSLEFVASMAELQERSRAFDLAIENIYTRTRRVLARYAGLDYNSSRSEIASRVAERSSIDERKLETLMRQCEEAINGAPITARQSIELVRRLRDVERRLGLFIRQRDIRQAAENI
ncbi:MAG TPA: DUF4350 domain-containing protein [Pyrinomonadaceae bacterium]|jgi:hypothetical protein|nr:DUF4350 domain-containing protein [Pyrinomonadaceae bacterium]